MNSIVDLFENAQNIQKSAAQLENAFKRVQATPAEQDSRTECCLLKPDITSPLHEFGI